MKLPEKSKSRNVSHSNWSFHFSSSFQIQSPNGHPLPWGPSVAEPAKNKPPLIMFLDHSPRFTTPSWTTVFFALSFTFPKEVFWAKPYPTVDLNMCTVNSLVVPMHPAPIRLPVQIAFGCFVKRPSNEYRLCTDPANFSQLYQDIDTCVKSWCKHVLHILWSCCHVINSIQQSSCQPQLSQPAAGADFREQHCWGGGQLGQQTDRATACASGLPYLAKVRSQVKRLRLLTATENKYLTQIIITSTSSIY